MRFSSLQEHILITTYKKGNKREKVSRKFLNEFYNNVNEKPKKFFIQKIITKSIERLIQREFLIGFGVKTKDKWFIKEVKLTKKGIKVCKKILDNQLALPFVFKKIRGK